MNALTPIFGRCRPCAWLFALCLAALSAPLAAAPDAAQGVWEQAHPRPLYWDNVEAAPAWVAGVRPQYDWASGQHVVRFAPGDSVTVRVPAYQWLRLQTATAAPVSVQVSASNGSGLYVPEAMRAGSEPNERLSTTLSDADRWLRVSWPDTATELLTLTLYVSRAAEAVDALSYHADVPLHGVSAVRLGDRPGAQDYWQLAETDHATLKITGPVRLTLVTRARLEPADVSSMIPYRLAVQLDGQPYTALDFMAQPEHQSVVELDRCAGAFTRRESGYLDVPAGDHAITLHASRAVVVQVRAERATADYLFDSNYHAPPAPWATLFHPLGLWAEQVIQMSARTNEPWLAWLHAQRVSRDTGWQPGSLPTAARVAAAADYSVAYQTRRALAERIRGAGTRFVDLLPLPQTTAVSQRRLTFATAALVDTQAPVVLQQAALRQLAAQNATASFVRLANDPAQAMQYRLSSVEGVTALRLAAYSTDRSVPVRIAVQGEDGRVFHLDVRTEPASAKYRPSLAQLATAAQRSVAAHDGETPPPLQVAWGELELPADMRVIRVWSSAPDVWVAIQQRRSRMYSGSEADYLAALSTAPGNPLQAFLDQLDTARSTQQRMHAPATDPAQSDLDNLWRPVLRQLLIERAFLAPAQTMGNASVAQAGNHRNRTALRERAEAAEQRGDWVAAVEAWSDLLRNAPVTEHADLRLRRAQALAAQREFALAENELWQLLLTTEHDDIQTRVLQTYRAMVQDDVDALARLYTAALVEWPRPERLAAAVQAWVDAGEDERALKLGLLLPVEMRPLETLIQAASRAGWWQTLALLVQDSPDSELYHYAHALRAQGEHDDERARWHAAQAGTRGAAVEQKRREAAAIRDALAADDPQQRGTALTAWADWQQSGLEDGAWRDADDAIVGSAGSARMLLPEYGLESVLYRALPQTPMALTVQGPTRLRVRLRPVFAAAEVPQWDDWLLVDDNGHKRRIAVSANGWDETRRLDGQADMRLGQQRSVEFDIGAGLHQLQIHLRDHPVLMQVDARLADPSELYLPSLTAERRAWLSENDTAVYTDTVHWPVRLVDDCDSRWLQLATTSLAMPLALSETGDRAVAGQNDRSRDERIRTQLESLLWEAEQDPRAVTALAVQFNAVLADLPSAYPYRDLVGRFERTLAWESVTMVQQSAGIHEREVPRNAVEHPTARVRAALLPPLDENTMRLTGNEVLVLSVDQRVRGDYRLDLTAESLNPVWGPAPVVLVSVDDGKDQAVTVDREKAVMRVPLQAGAHSIRMRLQTPLTQTAVRVAVAESTQQNGSRPLQTEPLPRTYQVSTRAEPLVVSVFGPARLRVDEWFAEHTRSRYLDVTSGWQQVTLAPNAGVQALLRVFVLASNPPDLRGARPLVHPRTPALPDLPPIPLSPAMLPMAEATVADEFSLGDQEDGTWSLMLAPTQRRNLNEDASVSDRAERYTEFMATHRLYLPWHDAYHRFDALYRLRADGGDTLGLRERYTTRWDRFDLDVDLGASLYAQAGEAELDSEWLGEINVELAQQRDLSYWTYHQPSLRLFQRQMSLDVLPASAPERVDQDVFTRYKSDHTRALRLGDRVYHRPLNDVLLFAGAALTTNENLSPGDMDHANLDFGARTLVGDLAIGLDLGLARYFADDDRAGDIDRRRLRLKLDWMRWFEQGNALDMSAILEREQTSGDNAAQLRLTWHFGKGRLMRDFRDEEASFRGLRERHAAARLYDGENAP